MGKENRLRALLALTGFSNESLKRLITFIRVIENKELNQLVLKDRWNKEEKSSKQEMKEWTDNKTLQKIQQDPFFRKGLVNLFFSGAGNPMIAKALPLFEVKKLTLEKLQFKVEELVDTLIRYKEKGSYSGKKENNPEFLLSHLLSSLNLTFEKGD